MNELIQPLKVYNLSGVYTPYGIIIICLYVKRTPSGVVKWSLVGNRISLLFLVDCKTCAGVQFLEPLNHKLVYCKYTNTLNIRKLVY